MTPNEDKYMTTGLGIGAVFGFVMGVCFSLIFCAIGVGCK